MARQNEHREAQVGRTGREKTLVKTTLPKFNSETIWKNLSQ